MGNIFFTADPHLGHQKVLKYQPNRIQMMGLTDENDIEGHDQYFIEMWHNMTKRGDEVYVLGDFVLQPVDKALKYLQQLKSKGCKIHFIIGNHDKSCTNQLVSNMFVSSSLIKECAFKRTVFPFLDDTFRCVLCHYPMLSWPCKAHGSVCLHGHTHDNSPWENNTDDLRLNVGIDTEFANGKLVPLEKVYEWYKNKLNGLTPHEYIEKCTRENPYFVR